MLISSLFILYAIMLGMIASYFLIEGTHTISFGDIYDQTKRGWWVGDNIALAKSMIVEKSRAYYGFCLLSISFTFQLFALFSNEGDLNFNIPLILAITISVLFPVFTYFITKFLIDKRVSRLLKEYERFQQEKQQK